LLGKNVRKKTFDELVQKKKWKNYIDVITPYVEPYLRSKLPEYQQYWGEAATGSVRKWSPIILELFRRKSEIKNTNNFLHVTGDPIVVKSQTNTTTANKPKVKTVSRYKIEQLEALDKEFGCNVCCQKNRRPKVPQQTTKVLSDQEIRDELVAHYPLLIHTGFVSVYGKNNDEVSEIIRYINQVDYAKENKYVD
jgi:hypothetical protein